MADKFTEFAGRMGKAPKGVGTGLKLLAAAAAVAYGVKESIYTVDGGHRAIIFSRIGGIQDNIYTEGLHFRIPWFQYPIIYDIRSKPRKIVSPTGSKDLQMVNIGLRVLARPQATMLPEMYRKLGLDFDERVLPSIMNEVLKSVVAQFNASQLITMRQEVSLLIRRQLTDRAKDFYVILDDVSITDLSFGREYTAAIEAKQVAQQEAQRAQFHVEKAIQERQQKIVQAEGEAKAATLISFSPLKGMFSMLIIVDNYLNIFYHVQSLTFFHLGNAIKGNPGYLKLRKIRAAQTVSNTISNSQNMVFLDSGALMLNVREADDLEETLGLETKSKKK
ncbi:unnamed protein product [Porites evermanni]|uniref:Prohibitin n=2 Tax=Porites evermanni TaxID=104178 RepID=A0ABN8QUX8_9CNID|nr:unnamed protein product [Porites evermanni]